MQHRPSIHGFSLVELSIVLVILGLLTGGILAGQSLIRASELRSVSAEAARYSAAANAFRDKYQQIPGDISNATSFWTTGANCNVRSNVAGSGTCNGDGNGNINGMGCDYTDEMFLFWQHLSLAGMIEGNYTGRNSGTDGAGLPGFTGGLNSPASKLKNALWVATGMIFGAGRGGGASQYHLTSGFSICNDPAMPYYHSLLIMAPVTTASSPLPVLKPEEAWNIDTKMDDGRPATGNVVAARYGTCDNGTAVNDLTGTYLLTSSDIACSLYFRKAY